ncbi:hypothetical protein [Aeromonas hydrophila]|uniref:hypothetical protein n=1 Tax=Aeromonas hydrophila TaxID=644 RepID=UPI001FC872D9|nr:hypothetical protein [Aeromonas hydrophila]GKQ97307.1 hypothetical protein KAM461_15570 [Aeromonas hydrophila]
MNKLVKKETGQCSAQMVLVGNHFGPILRVGGVKAYRPLYKKAASVTLAVAVFDVEGRHLCYQTFDDVAAQRAYLDSIKSTLSDAGVLDMFEVLPDGCLIRPSIVKGGAHAPADYGYCLTLLGEPRKGESGAQRLLTALMESRAAALDYMPTLLARINAA